MIKKIVLVILLAGSLLGADQTQAAMSSTNYYIYADALDTGGVNSTSTSYSVQDTIGEAAGDVTTSSSYIVRGGYQGAELGNLTMTISASSVGLGTLSSNQVSVGSSIVSITTDSNTGYSLSIGSVSGAGLAAVSDGTVTAGVEEYGVAVVGAERAFTNDQGITAGLLLASSATPISSSQSTLTFKASISGSSTAGSYSQTVSLTASANL